MRERTFFAGLISCTGLAMLAALSGCSNETRPRTLIDTVSLGRNAASEPCSASRNWRDSGATDMFDSAYVITCRNAAASRALGSVRVVAEKPETLARIDALYDCGQPAAVTVRGRGGQARRCTDKALGLETVRLDVPMGDTRVIASADPSLIGPLEESVAIFTGRASATGDPQREPKPTIDIAALPAGPASLPVETAGAVDQNSALRQGIALNHNGRHAEASRILNDAISRLSADADPSTRAELLLEAGLADSNVGFEDSSQARFAQAEPLIAASSPERASFLQRKRDSYIALDLLNRRDFRGALTALNRLVSADVSATEPLMDVSTVRRLNQGGTDRVAQAVAVPDTRQLSQLVLDAQANWARSVAYLALGDEARSTTALDAATRAYRALLGERIDPTQSLWLGARIERQRGRIAERRKDWPTALAAFDLGIRYLQRSAVGNLGTASEPAIAEARLERAGVLARSGAPAEQVRRDYAGVVDALIAANSSGTITPTGLENYLDLLVGEAARTPRADTYELFFRALQSGGQPGVARQLNQLQTVVAADPALAQLIQDKAGIERDLTRLRYALADNEETPGESERTLEQQRVRAEARLLAINAALSRNPRYRAVDDSPATIADIRAALKPGEGYLKLFQLSNRLYGIYVTQSQAFIYTVAKSAAELDQVNQVSTAVRGSIDGRLQDGQLVPYDVARSHVLFRIITGPARDTMMQTKSLIVDPAGPLTTIPIGALVTEFDPKVVREDPFDFSQTAFLAARSTISTALSPRSFLVARDLAPSHAPREFIGFGAHIPPAAANTDRVVDVGFGCTVPYNRLAVISRAFTPIDRRELTVAAQALGDPQAPLITAADFTDTAIEQRGDLTQYQILHFATHGLQEGQWGCAKSPPALVTSFGDAQSDGLLSFSEIAQLRLDANLVVLSACDTIAGVRDQALARAFGQEEAGSTLEGLVRAFLAANARSVMATYWPVSAEQESIDLMREFYAAARTQTIGQSLQTAQRTLMREPKYSHPFYWAPYFIVGDSTKPMLTPSARPQIVASR